MDPNGDDFKFVKISYFNFSLNFSETSESLMYIQSLNRDVADIVVCTSKLS